MCVGDVVVGAAYSGSDEMLELDRVSAQKIEGVVETMSKILFGVTSLIPKARAGRRHVSRLRVPVHG